MLGILHRKILLELFRVFILSLVGLTGILLMAGIVVEASQRGLGPAQILAAIPLLIPSTLPYTLPTTTLFATCVVYGRLAHDNEILAIKSAGINLMQVIWPGIFMGLGVTGGTLALYGQIIPVSHHLLRNQVLADIEEVLYATLRREGRLSHPKLNYHIYVKRVQNRTLLHATFMRRDATGQRFDLIATADEAELRVDVARKQVIVHMRRCDISRDGQDSIRVQEEEWPVDFDFGAEAKFRTNDMTWQELFTRQAQIGDEIEKLDSEIAMHQAAIALKTAPDHYPNHVQNLRHQKEHKVRELHSVETEIHMRPALAVGCLCFVLIGCPVGIWFSKSDYLSAFITCFLPIVFLYYPLMLCLIKISANGRIPPAVGVWAANGLMMVIAMGLFKRLLRN